MATYYKMLDMDGVDDRVIVPHDASLNQNSYMTYEMWVEASAKADPSYFVHRYNFTTPNNGVFYVGTNAYGANPRCLYFGVSGTGSSWTKVWQQTTTSIGTSGWYHVVLAVDQGQPEMYVNGVKLTGWHKGTDGAMTALYAATAELVVGYGGALGAGLGPWALWGGTAVLSAADVAARYAAGPVADPAAYTPAAGCTLISPWNRNTSLTYPTIPDNGTNNNDATMTNMTAGDIVDSPWALTSCLYVPGGYTVIPNSVFFPSSVIVEGEDDPTDGSDSTTKGLVDLACNSNYLHKRVTKTYVYQDLTSAADEGYIEYDEAAAGPGVLVGTWYVPALLDGQGLDVTVRARTTTAADTTLKVQIHDADRSSLIFDSSAISSTSWTDIVLSFTPAEIQAFKDTAGVDAPFFLDLYTEYIDYTTVAQIKGITASSTDDGENDLTSGIRGDGHIPQCWQRWNAQSPLPVSRMEELQENIEAFRTEKVSTFAAYSDFPSDSGNAVYSSPESSAEWQTVAVIPVPYMPGVTSLGFALTGFYAVADDRLRVIAASGLVDEDTPSEITFTDPVGTWDTTDETQWQTGAVAVKEAFSAMGFASVYVQMKSPTTRGQALMGLALWEVY